MISLNKALYRKLYLARRAEEYIIKYYPNDEMKTPMHMSMGQEFVPVGVCHALGARGQIFATYRSHAAFLARTGDTDLFFAELYGKTLGTAQGKAGSMHLSAPEQGYILSSGIVASCIPLAVGAAFANQQLGRDNIACVFFGDGATNEGVFWESLNVACLMQLPVLFVCEDNNYAVHTPVKARQGYDRIVDIVSQFQCNVFEVETTWAEDVYDLTCQAMNVVGPSFIYAPCWRYLEHVGINPDYDAGYRDAKTLTEWHILDCVEMQREFLLCTGAPESNIVQMEQEIDQQIMRSIERAQDAPMDTQLYKGVFHEEK